MLKWFWPAAMALKVEHLEMLKKNSTFSYNWVQYVYTRHQNKASVHANTKYDKIDYMRTTLYGFLIEWRIAILTKTVRLSFRSYSCRGNYDSPLIGYFRVPKTLTVKTRPSARFFLWKWGLFAQEWKIIAVSKAEHLTSFWYRGPGEPRKWPIVNHSAAVNVNHSSGLIYHLNKPVLI